MIEIFKTFGDKTAIVHKDAKHSYSELYEKITKLKQSIKDIKSGEVVAILSDYSFESIALFFALYQNKNIIVPIISQKQAEIDLKLEESFATKFINIADESLSIHSLNQTKTHEMLKSLRQANRAGLILFSSGSTGKPKAMIHDLDTLISHYNDKKEKSINMIIFLMFDRIGGLNTLFNILSIDATAIIPQNRNADDVCKLLAEYKIMVLPSSPTFLNLILMSNANKKYDLSSLRMITYGTEPMPDSLLQRLKAEFPRVKFLQTFGTSETGIANTSSMSSNSTFMKIDDMNLEYKIVDGELWLKSKAQILGYLNSSMQSFSDDGWFKTGDLVETTEDGYIKIIGRNKEIINIGGEKVLPNEVESVILSMDEVDDCLVYGEKNAITGQSVSCDVVLKQGIDSQNIKIKVRKFCKDKLANYKIPTKVTAVERTNFGERFKKKRILG
ncbi:ANL family adenylate-forming protein [Campylobacter suis]|uniref:3-[(3aS,4S,7aS)-7a-methyl-1, 5-dioxo-octahydro-1H-inden-4-yl]propanoyl:CoA ligase n=1 Tax=Campylobacter suis TaxID=2790657 RepID=A0ABN7KB78_9BACT|nr:class I adenylate-forming enzyme family protein [Campylobacter suis]CAD7289031.1 3-[(3aS,4S,7aS)-7a-methyl-1, 5-dioxo-octahydro-1H-inden-4-yl]propanoyl:CoA ligase [Campylobacter suis]